MVIDHSERFPLAGLVSLSAILYLPREKDLLGVPSERHAAGL